MASQAALHMPYLLMLELEVPRIPPGGLCSGSSKSDRSVHVIWIENNLKNSFEAIRGIVINAMLVDADVCFAYVISKKKLKENSRKIQGNVFFIELKIMKQKMDIRLVITYSFSPSIETRE